jgi:hypothetical protein
MKNYYALLPILFSSFPAFAASIQNDTPIIFNFPSKEVLFHGVFMPGQGNAKTQGLDAEIAARRNGIAHLNSFLASSCGQASVEKNEGVSGTPSWQAVVKSQGSEIFSNRVLKISLVAPVRDILKNMSKTNVKTLQTKDGQQIALKLPKMPASALKCGLITLTLGSRNVALNPLASSTDSNAKVVQLIADGSAGVKPAETVDREILENSSLLSQTE